MSKRKSKYERLGRSVPVNRGGLSRYTGIGNNKRASYDSKLHADAAKANSWTADWLPPFGDPSYMATQGDQRMNDFWDYIHGNKSGNASSTETESFATFLRNLIWDQRNYNINGEYTGTNIYNQLAAYLQNMSQDGNLSTEIRDQIRTLLLQLSLNQDQRQYDYSMLKDQRAYDRSQLDDSRQYNDPLNQLARLTGAGIGRDAALGILSGSAGNIGSAGSSGSAIGSQGGAAPSVPAPSGSMDLARANFSINAVNASVAALQSLVNSGVSLATGISQVQAQQNANYWNQQQISANESVTQLATAIQSMQDHGIIESSQIESLSNSNDLIKYLQSISKDNEQVSQLLDSNAYKSALGTPFGRQRFNDYWKSLRDSRDSGTLYDEFIKQQRLNNYLSEANISKVGSELALIDAQTNSEYQALVESATRIASMEADIEVKNAQGDWIRIQTDNYQRLADAQYNQIVAQTEGTQIQNNINRDLFELNHAGFPMLKQVYLDELNDKVAYWSTINDPEVRQNKINHWLLDERNAYKAAYLENLRLQAVGSFANDHPDTWRLIQAWNYVGAGDAVRTGLKVGADALGVAKFAL